MSATTDLAPNQSDPSDLTDGAAPALQLDKRQRAMLREMGVRVWLPLPVSVVREPATVIAPAAAQNATHSIAIDAHETGATAAFDAKKEVLTVSAVRKQPAALTPADPRRQVPSTATLVPVSNNLAPNRLAALPSWQVAEPQSLYADASGKDSAARWLVLAESPAQALKEQFNPFDGDAGKLLDNMLRAACLHMAAAIVFVPLVRQTDVSAAQVDAVPAASDLQIRLQALVEGSRPDVVLVMGRLSAQAVLQSSTAFGKLRGQIHQLHGVPTIVMQDAAFLLRALPEKARAWDDLCLAMSVLQKHY